MCSNVDNFNNRNLFLRSKLFDILILFLKYNFSKKVYFENKIAWKESNETYLHLCPLFNKYFNAWAQNHIRKRRYPLDISTIDVNVKPPAYSSSSTSWSLFVIPLHIHQTQTEYSYTDCGAHCCGWFDSGTIAEVLRGVFDAFIYNLEVIRIIASTCKTVLIYFGHGQLFSETAYSCIRS